MSRYWEIPQLSFEKVLKDLKEGKLPVTLEFADSHGRVAGENKGYPRVFDGKNYLWLYEGVVYKGSLGVKVYGGNDEEKFFEILREQYGSITPVYEEELGILHVG